LDATEARKLPLTTLQGVAVASLERSNVFKLVQRGRLPFVHLGRAVPVRAANLEKWVAEQAE